MTTTTPAALGSAFGASGLQPEVRLETLDVHLDRWARERPDVVAHTFLDYLASADDEPVVRTLTWRELAVASRATAALLQQTTVPGDRVAILAASGPEYVVAFLGALRAGAVAVPLFSPDLYGHGERLDLVLADCRPAAVLTTTPTLDAVERCLAGVDALAGAVPPVVCVDDLLGEAGEALAEAFVPVPLDLDALAYLQYTSGSTRTPAGVALSHRNHVVNAWQIIHAHTVVEQSTAVTWLPLFHDMGLMLGAIGPVVAGIPSVVMDPVSFVLRPARWIRAIGSYPKVITAGPNFAYDLAARRTRPEDLEGVDLRNVASLVNGAEPILPPALARFAAAFEPHGLDPLAMAPSYGLAEAVVCVTTTGTGEPTVYLDADVDALQRDRLVPAEDGGRAVRLVGCGRPAEQQVAIVDPATSTVRAEGEVGEIWVRGDNVGLGYAGRDQLTETTFGAVLADGEGPWLRTGDLGAVVDGLLFVTGRLKDLIIVDGRNVYPQDLELSAQEADRAIAMNRLAAFSVEATAVGADGAGEAVVVVAEAHRSAVGSVADRFAEIDRAVRRAASDVHGVALHEVVLVAPDTIPRTSSGKIARRATRDAYLAGSLQRVGAGA